MAAATPNTDSHENAFRGFDRSIERLIGADLRLVYGFAVPILMIVGLITVLALTPATWLVGLILILEIGALGIVVAGIMGMLSEDDEDPEAEATI